MVTLPTTADSPVIRTDFSDQDAWEAARAAILAPAAYAKLLTAHVEFVDDPGYADKTPTQVLDLITDEFTDSHPCLFIVDQTTLSSVEWPVLVMDLWDQKGRMFRTVADELFSIESNLSVSNMSFSEFADAADASGVFRGFGDLPRAELMARLPASMLNPPGHRPPP
jgi:hypothetical protein